jgi:Na+/melibiose symporter-like transporter
MTSIFPLVGMGQASDGIPSSLATGNPLSNAASVPTSTTSNSLSGVKGALAQVGRAATSTGNSFLNAIFGNNYQYLTGIIGLLLIVAGIFLFRPVRDTVVNVSKTVGTAAAKGAIAA